MEKLYNIFLIGPMGSGKSTIGNKLSKMMNFDFYDSDEQVEKQSGYTISTLFKLKGEKFFRNYEKKIISKFTKKKNIVLSTGGGSILSKTSRNNLRKRGFVVYLSVNLKTQVERVKESNRPLIKNCEHINILLKKLYLERKVLYNKIYDFKIDTSNNSVFFIKNKIFQKFKKILRNYKKTKNENNICTIKK